jgi:hypothetical protein
MIVERENHGASAVTDLSKSTRMPLAISGRRNQVAALRRSPIDCR